MKKTEDGHSSDGADGPDGGPDAPIPYNRFAEPRPRGYFIVDQVTPKTGQFKQLVELMVEKRIRNVHLRVVIMTEGQTLEQGAINAIKKHATAMNRLLAPRNIRIDVFTSFKGWDDLFLATEGLPNMTISCDVWHYYWKLAIWATKAAKV